MFHKLNFSLSAVDAIRRSRYMLLWLSAGAGITVLVMFSAKLAATRIYQVDECQNLYMARVVATDQAATFFTNASLFLLGPLSWMAKGAIRSAEFFANARLLFLGVFWLNVILLALNASGRLIGSKGLLALGTAATLAPCWDYGFEIRHDNLILTGVFLIWWAVRVRSGGRAAYFLAGAVTVICLFISIKALVYVVPLSLAILAFPPTGHASTRWRLGISYTLGALLALVLVRWSYGAAGLWDVYLAEFRNVAKYSASQGGIRGSALWWTISRLFTQTPLLLALTVSACAAFCLDLWRRRKAALSWQGDLPEALLFFGAIAGLIVNPTPFPYNLLHVVPYAFLFSFRHAVDLWTKLRHQPNLLPLFVGILVFAHLVPFTLATRRHLEWSNLHQESVMSLAETLTDPVKDPVYDAIGMVPSRRSVCFEWYLHSLNIRKFLDGSGPHVRDILAATPAAVFIPSYRTDWLPAADHAFIRERYVSFSDDFWVLGKVLPAGGGTFEIIHPGRYRISSLQGSDLAGTYPQDLSALLTPEDAGTLYGTLDGSSLPGIPVELAVGMHRIECPSNLQPAVVWVGPKLQRVHRRSGGDHLTLFVNWY